MKKCDVCNCKDNIHYRVKSNRYKDWIFSCKKCWDTIAKQNEYKYGGTRKS